MPAGARGGRRGGAGRAHVELAARRAGMRAAGATPRDARLPCNNCCACSTQLLRPEAELWRWLNERVITCSALLQPLASLIEQCVDTRCVLAQALGPGSDDPASLLVAASQHHAEQDTKCETILESIRHSGLPDQQKGRVARGRGSKGGGAEGSDEPLADAVRDCADASGWVVGIESQRQLLRAAIYGRSHAPVLVDAALIPTTALHCRVVNSLRMPDVVRSSVRAH